MDVDKIVAGALANVFRRLGDTVLISLQPSSLGLTGELWTISHSGKLGQGDTLEEALADYAADTFRSRITEGGA